MRFAGRIGCALISLGCWVSPAYGALEDLFPSDSDRTWIQASEGAYDRKMGVWDLFLYGGPSQVTQFHGEMTTQPYSSYLQTALRLIYLNFSARTVSTDQLDNGIAVGMGIHRDLLRWLTVGLEAGYSFSHSQTVEEGDITYFDGTTTTIVPYYLDYRVYMLHVSPVLKLGPWIPVGHFAMKPYVTGGVGWNQVEEKVTFFAVDAEFQLGIRNTSSIGYLYGTGLDFKFLENAALGVQYQGQNINKHPDPVKLSNWLMRFSYIF